jgi:hypothetical protein
VIPVGFFHPHSPSAGLAEKSFKLIGGNFFRDWKTRIGGVALVASGFIHIMNFALRIFKLPHLSGPALMDPLLAFSVYVHA